MSNKEIIEQKKKNARKQRGASLVEYALLVGMLVAVGLAVIPGFTTSVTNLFGRISGDIDGVAP
jgi:Flp pilus assembly pilin Flp